MFSFYYFLVSIVTILSFSSAFGQIQASINANAKYGVNVGETKDIYTDTGECIRVTNNCTVKNKKVFVPLKTVAEVTQNRTRVASCITQTTCGPNNGLCGPLNESGTNVTGAETASQLCSAGTFGAYVSGSPDTWQCAGSSGGSTANCTSKLNGVCGPAHQTNPSSAPSTAAQLCSSGFGGSVFNYTASDPWKWWWICTGMEGGTSPTCVAGSNLTNGACGSLAGSGINVTGGESASQLCASGSFGSYVSGAPDTWKCTGAGGGSTASCNNKVNGSCGSAHGQEPSSTPFSSLCSSGLSSSVTTDSVGTWVYDWTCAGQEGGTTATCGSKTNVYTLSYSGSTHTNVNCTSAGGTVVLTPLGDLCKFSGATCPGGWSPADNWSTWSQKTGPSWSQASLAAVTYNCGSISKQLDAVRSRSTTTYYPNNSSDPVKGSSSRNWSNDASTPSGSCVILGDPPTETLYNSSPGCSDASITSNTWQGTSRICSESTTIPQRMNSIMFLSVSSVGIPQYYRVKYTRPIIGTLNVSDYTYQSEIGCK